MSITITGTVREKENQEGLPGLRVEAFDADFLTDDLLGRTTTGGDGRTIIPSTTLPIRAVRENLSSAAVSREANC